MFDDSSSDRRLDRRGFLKGSALFAAAVGLSAAVPAAAQEPQNRPAPEQKPDEKKEEPPKTEEAGKKKPLIDKDGREYRVCEMCGSNMYKHEKTWTCEQCGYSYEE